MSLSVAFLGDVMLGRGVAQALPSPPGEVWDPALRELARGCDVVVCNVECCLSDRGDPTDLVPGKPFFFRGPPEAVEALLAIGTDVAGVANNHALDYGPDALSDTVAHLREAGIVPVGAGSSVEDARRGAVVEAGIAVGVVAVSDHPSSFAAGDGSPGIAYADLRAGLPAWLTEEIARLRGECDVVIAFPHWGPNMTTEPASWQRHRAAELVEAGADLVAGHSAHCFHGVALAGDRPLLYDLGDALDDYRVDPKLRNDIGLLVIWRPDAEPRLELVGLSLEYARTELATGNDADWFAARVARACEALGTRVERVGEQRFAVVGVRRP
jgi:poly-gamma-glutamate synthesis protein (capsule biosynthesis protein)